MLACGRTVVATVAALLTLLTTTAAYAEPAAIPSESDVDYQLGGPWNGVPEHVGIVVRDRTAQPLAGRFNVCYVNGFQTQPDERRFWRRHHWDLVLKDGGKAVEDEAWGEWLLDIRTRSKRQRLARIVGRWTARCAEDGFVAAEFDNLDSFTRSHGLLKRRHAIAFARLLVRKAHASDLAAGQKNLAGFDGTTIGFDFAVAEECGRWNECAAYAADFGDQVLAIEYRDQDFAVTCEQYGDQWPVVRRNLALTPDGPHDWC